MSTFYATYPSTVTAGSNASVGPNGQTAPSSSTEVAGVNPGGNLTPISVDNAGNQNVNVISSALPTGGATAANQVIENNSLASIDSKTPALVGGSVPVEVTSSTLPTGASTSALQTSGNASLTSIDSKTPALGQALSAASVPVVLPASQITALTPPTTVTVVQPTGTNLHTVVDSGTITNKEGTPAAGTVTNAAITVGTTAVRLTVSGSAPSATRSVLVATVDNASTASFFIGGSTVTNSGATRGIEVVAGQPFITNNDAGDYYIVSSLAAQTVYVLEQA